MIGFGIRRLILLSLFGIVLDFMVVILCRLRSRVSRSNIRRRNKCGLVTVRRRSRVRISRRLVRGPFLRVLSCRRRMLRVTVRRSVIFLGLLVLWWRNVVWIVGLVLRMMGRVTNWGRLGVVRLASLVTTLVRLMLMSGRARCLAMSTAPLLKLFLRLGLRL